MSAPADKDVERIKLKYDITGIGRAGDYLIHIPDHANPSLRLVRVHPMDEARLPEIKEKVQQEEDYFAEDGESLLESLLS